ncbi:hypothetical protein CDAR_95441 [Caerostris darwini]|uniref:Uncharacterized protein n=1 Tax=Caerostris darwini TaxID=1538125 RepID=A0AAV4PLP3_9ARAC|nr:hypothetical protein CDAR_95441 [Caerostris darwini]
MSSPTKRGNMPECRGEGRRNEASESTTSGQRLSWKSMSARSIEPNRAAFTKSFGATANGSILTPETRMRTHAHESGHWQ